MTNLHIESPQNPRIKAWRALRSRSERDATDTFLVEGERETLRGAAHLELVTSIIRDDRTDVDLPNTVTVSSKAFDRLSARQNPDGVAGVFRTPAHDLDGLTLDDTTLILIADGVEKPGNIGAMIRTADAFGAAFVGASLGTDLYNPNVVRSAQGSLFAVPTASAPRADVSAWAGTHGTIVVTTPDADLSIWDVDFSGPTSIVVGSEHDGVDASWLTEASGCRIPTSGDADSLNASVAAAVFLAEAVRQRSV
ncbi:MAG: TrmH family RNA methyltransferase [Acidimicrobiia bacterium]